MNILTSLIQEFSVDSLTYFFRQKLPTFKVVQENYAYLFEDKNEIADNYRDIEKIGDADLGNADDLIVIAAKTIAPLTTRTGKKRQYEIAKRILREENKDASFFIFYDNEGNFRFSFIRVNFLGTRREFTDFKRYTYFVSRELTNKTFITQISKADFNNLDKVLEAFNVEPLTKQFYEKLQHWYFWALENVKFPNDAEEEPNGREMAVIRLITRLMFIWFMKVRNLIPANLFDEENLSRILKDMAPEPSTFYRAILQNLFFATLNTKQEERRYRSETRGPKGHNPDFGNHNVYRYQKLFTDPERLEDLFSRIPFLNGGLFECLDYKSREKEERKYIDGFTATIKQQPVVPNFLFFSPEQKVDINKYFGSQNKSYNVMGLIPLLNSFNFTIDENEPDDIEVALDPELLGSIFENLLASYNPETATTARKATGSFYTPREIVNYMTTESLKEYFRTRLAGHPVDDPDNKLARLFSSGDESNPFDPDTTERLIRLIDDLRIVDPAVGSGAFPMTILNKLVFVLGKLDPENRRWEASQIEGVRKAVSDPVLQSRLIEEVKKRFREKNADYGRKLYLIEKCIYGVDIQQIAVEIAKLRFFISLLVDEKVEPDRPNYGIESLPNLDFKIMQGNSLISTYVGIDFSHSEENPGRLLLDNGDGYRELIREFEELKNEYQNEPDRERKNLLRQKIEKAILRIFEEKIAQTLPEIRRIEEMAAGIPVKEQREKYLTEEKEKLSRRLGFDIGQAKKELIAYTEGRKPKDFFLWEVYFAEVFTQKCGFDIVIGNPPYIQLQKAVNGRLKFADLYKNEDFETFERTGDIYALFYEKGMNLLNEKGVLCYITSNKWMRANYGKSLRKFFTRKNPLKLIDLGPGVFNTVTVDTNILLMGNHKVNELEGTQVRALTLTKKDQGMIMNLSKKDFLTLKNLSEKSWIILTPEEYAVKQKIERIGTPLKDWDINIYRGVLTGYNEAFIIDGRKKEELIAKDPESAEIIKPILRGRDIKRYKAEFADLWLLFIPWHFPLHKDQSISGASEEAEKRFKEQYPYIYEHLLKFKEKLSQRNKAETGIRYEWYALQRCAATYYEEFEKEKIVWKRIGSVIRFSFSNNGELSLDSTVIAVGNNLKYLTTILNSKLYIRELLFNSPKTGTGDVIISVQALNPLLVYIPSKVETKIFEELFDKIIIKNEKNEDTTAEEQEIDVMVYKLYELTYDEVKVVDPAFSLSRESYDNLTL